MQPPLVAQIDGTFYHGLHSGLIKEAKKHGLPTALDETINVLLGEPGQVCTLHLSLRPILRQILGRQAAAFDFPLARERERIIRFCGGIFAPNVYHVVGDILRLADLPKTQFNAEDRYEMIVNCGLPVEMSQRGRTVPHLDRSKLETDSWVAAIGHLAAWPDAKNSPDSVQSKILGVSMFDLNPNSGTFGTVIPWSFLKKAPADADVIPVPTIFLTLQIVGDEM